MDVAVILAGLAIIAYIILYFGGRYYLSDGFQDKAQDEGRNCQTVLDTSYLQYKPYMTNQDKYGDFEGDFIYQNEGGFDPTQEAINQARRRFPFDWSQLPPSSSLFQAQQALFVKDDATATAAPFKKETFENIDSMKVLPPDGSEDQAETDALKAYQPKTSGDLKTVDQGSVDALINKIYGDKGLVAKVARQANNVFQVYEVQEVNPQITYEDDVQASIQDNALNPMVQPSDMLVTPGVASELAVGLSPLGRGQSTNVERQAYSNYNPNLENLYGPKMQMQQWG